MMGVARGFLFLHPEGFRERWGPLGRPPSSLTACSIHASDRAAFSCEETRW